MNLVQEDLASKHMKLAHFLANKNHNRRYEYEEIFSAALTGLAKAIKDFDVSRGVQFSTFAYRSIESEIYKFYKAMNAKMRKGQTVSIESIVFEEGGTKITLLDLLPDESDLDKEPWEEINLALNKVLDQMEPRNRKILTKYLNGQTQGEIGEEYGLSQVHVSRIIRGAFAKVREEYWRYVS